MKAVGALLVLLAGCAHPAARTTTATAESLGGTAPGSVRLVALCELPRSEISEGLSGTWFDPATRTLFALQDTVPRIVPLVASADFRSWNAGTPITLQGRPSASWDGEALSRAGNEFLAIADEGAGRIERFDAAGHFLGALAVPERFAQQARDNKGVEGLSVSPGERFLFVANEAALVDDGPLATHALGTTVRILRHELASGREEQRAYRTEPLGAGGDGEMGVSDLTAVSDDVLLVLERGYQAGYGNTVRIFRVDFRASDAAGGSAPAPSGGAATGGLDPATPLLRKTLVIDLATLPARGVTRDSPQPNPVLENYEALALGSVQPDGRRLLFVTADDNASSEQRPRILVLSAQIR